MSFPSDRLGPRDLATDYNETVELVQSVLLYDPDAIFYLIRLVANGLNRSVTTEISVCEDLLEAVDDLAQPDRPVESVSGLGTARNALVNMETALERGGVFGSTEYRKYTAGMERVKDELSRAVKMTYTPRGSSTTTTDVVRPLPEAKAAVATYYNTLVSQHSSMLTALQRLLSALSEFTAGRVEVKLGQRQVSRARTQVDELYELLDPLTPEERTAQARTALLKVLTNQASIKAMASPLRPGDAKLSQPPSSSPTYRLRAYGEGSAPQVVGTKSGPFPLSLSSAARYLQFSQFNDGPTGSIDLLPGNASDIKEIKAAEIEGSIPGKFAINQDREDPCPLYSDAETFNITATTDWFYIVVDGVSCRKQLTIGAARTASQVATELEASASWVPSKPAITVSDASGRVKIEYNGSTLPYRARSMEITRGVRYASDLWMGTPPNDYWYSGPGAPGSALQATRTTGWDANNQIQIKADDTPGVTTVTLPSGTWPDHLVDAGPAATPGTVAYAIDDSSAPVTSVAATATSRVIIRSDTEGEGSIVTLLSAGVHPVAHAKEGYATASKLGLETLGFVENQDVRESDVDSRAVARVLNRDATFSAGATASVEREEFWRVKDVQKGTASNELAAPYVTDPRADWPDYTELKLVIENGDNRGIYGLVASPGEDSGNITFLLDRDIRDTTSGLLHTVTLYRERLKITSTDAGLTGVLELTDPANSARTVLGLDDSEHVATVAEVLVEESNPTYGWRPSDISRNKIRVGDTILAGTLVEQTTISSVANTAVGRLGVSPEVAPSLSLDTEGFYIRSSSYQAYQTFIEALSSWQLVTLPPFREDLSTLDNVLAPVLLATPSKDRVDTVYAQVELLKTKLSGLVTILSTFSVRGVSGVDTALQTMLEQGFDRTRQLLLEGRFSDFFDAGPDTCSYARAFQKAVNEVAVEDINQSANAKGRYDAEFVRVSARWEEDNDPQTDFSDFEPEWTEDPVIDSYLGVNEYEGD